MTGEQTEETSPRRAPAGAGGDGRTAVAGVHSPIGVLVLEATEEALTHIHLPGSVPAVVAAPARGGAPGAAPAILERAARQLEEYFAGTRTEFDLPLSFGGTPFQEEVWRALAAIPYGRTVTYGELAAAVGRPRAFRAVGQANGANPIPIVLPCHRVVASAGKLGGYGGGLPMKRALLALEGAGRF